MAGRPPKDPSERKNVDLRIPVTEAQKQLISRAMAHSEREFASWARDLLLGAARTILDRHAAPKKQRTSKP
jgi:uncharacterized protein (DUF1778 family)